MYEAPLFRSPCSEDTNVGNPSAPDKTSLLHLLTESWHARAGGYTYEYASIT